MNQPYARVNQHYATLTRASALREMFGVQLYKNNARALLLRILSILNLRFKIQDSRFKFIKTKWQQSLNYMVIYNYKTLKITKSLY